MRKLAPLFMFLSVLAHAQAPVITSANPAVVQQGQTFQFTATGAGITWSVSGTGCSGSPCGSIVGATGVYTAPASVVPNHSFGGCQVFDNGHIYNTDISGASVDTNSATWITALSGTTLSYGFSPSEIPNNFDDGTSLTQNLTVNQGQGGNYLVLQPPFRREQAGYRLYTYNNSNATFFNQDHHFWMTYPSTCKFSQFYLVPLPGGSGNTQGANTINQWDSTLPVNQGVDAGGDWMFALAIKASELEAAVAAGATTLKHATRIVITNIILCNSGTANACGENATGTRFVWPATSNNQSGGGTIPFGACLRLKSTVNISAFTAVEQIILNTWKHYCVFITDGALGAFSFVPAVEPGPYSLSDINAANLPASDWEFPNIQSLATNGLTTGTTAGSDKVTATNGSGSASAYVTLVGPTIGLPYDDIPYSHLTFQAGTPPFQLTAFVNGTGTASSGVTWSMPNPSVFASFQTGNAQTQSNSQFSMAHIAAFKFTGSAPTHTQFCNAAATTCTFGSNLGAGHLLYICLATSTSGVTVTWSGDTDTFTTDITNRPDGFNSTFTSCAYVLSTTGGSAAITAGCSPACSSPVVFGDEYTGTSFTFDVSDAGLSNAQVYYSFSNSVTLGTANSELLIGVLSTRFNTTVGVGQNLGWTLNGTTQFQNTEYVVLPANAYGKVTTTGLFTPPAAVGGVPVTTTVKAQLAALSSATDTVYITTVPAGTMRFITNGQCGTGTSFNTPTGGICVNEQFYTDGSSNKWMGTLPAWNIAADNCGAFTVNSGDANVFANPGSAAAGDVRFDLHVPNGVYTVALNFMVGPCGYNNAPGLQNETLEIQGTALVTNLDIAAQVGSANPLTETFNNVVVNDGLLSIVLRATALGTVGPTISSMVINQTSGIVPNQAVGHLP